MNIYFLPSTVIKQLKTKLVENIQLADKVYFKTGLLDNDDGDAILKITGGDNFTKLISDFYIIKKKWAFDKSKMVKELEVLYDEVKKYDKNFYPIVGFDVFNAKDPDGLMHGLERRAEIKNEIKKLPSIAIRNLRNDIRKERTSSELQTYFNDLSYFMGMFSQLSNRDKDTQLKILRKMFKGNTTTLADLMKFVDDKANFIGGVDFTDEDVKKLAETEDIEIIYESGDIMIVRVESPDAIKAIGCNSLWCFTYGSGFSDAHRNWNQFSHNGMVYVIINFREKSDSEDFMHVMISPLINDNGRFIKYNEDNEDEHPIFNMSNENYSNPYRILESLFGAKYKAIIKKYLNFEY